MKLLSFIFAQLPVAFFFFKMTIFSYGYCFLDNDPFFFEFRTNCSSSKKKSVVYS